MAGSWISRKQYVLDREPALLELGAHLIVNLLSHHFTLAGVEGIGGMRSGGFTDGGAESGLNDNIFIVGSDFLEDFCGALRIEVIDERRIEAHHQAFAGWHAGRFLEGLRLDGKFIVGLQRIDEVNSFAQILARLDLAEKRQDPDVAGANTGYRTEEQNDQQKGHNTEPDEPQKVCVAGVDDARARWIEDGHWSFPLRDCKVGRDRW